MGKREKTLLPGFNTSTSSKNTVQFQQYFKYYICFSVPTAYRLEYDQFLFAIVAIHSSLSRNAFNTVQPGKLLKWFSSFYGWHRLLLVDLLCVEGDIRSEIGRMILNWNNRGSCWGGLSIRDNTAPGSILNSSSCFLSHPFTWHVGGTDSSWRGFDEMDGRKSAILRHAGACLLLFSFEMETLAISLALRGNRIPVS